MLLCNLEIKINNRVSHLWAVGRIGLEVTLIVVFGVVASVALASI